MFDTVRCNVSELVKVAPPRGWHSTSGDTTRRDGNRDSDSMADTSRYVALQHDRSGLRLYGFPLGSDDFLCRSLECSLPRVLHGSNGLLLKSQTEVEQAWLSVVELVSGVMVYPGKAIGTTFTRCDLVQQFGGEPAHWIHDLKRARHPQIRRATIEYHEESINFPGKHRHLRIYDKSKESKGRRGNVVRVELQLTGKPLNEALGTNISTGEVESLSFGRGYAAYREFLCRFEPVKRPKVGKLTDLLAYTLRTGIKDSSGLDLFDVWARDKHPRHVRRVLSQIQRAQILYDEFSFRDLLPSDGPPPPVELTA